MIKKMPDLCFEFPVIGLVHSCYKEKFGVPRQPGLAPAAEAIIEILPPYNAAAAFEGLECCSHIWLQFVFHLSLRQGWKPKVRPPRLGGNATLGVFATRSPVRPSSLGLSVVKLERLACSASGVEVHISGADLVDGTPVVDIKPYVPYVDAVASARYSIADTPPPLLPVIFSELALSQLDGHAGRVKLQALIEQVLQQDPRPKYQQTDPERVYGMNLLQFNVQWRCYSTADGDRIEVLKLND